MAWSSITHHTWSSSFSEHPVSKSSLPHSSSSSLLQLTSYPFMTQGKRNSTLNSSCSLILINWETANPYTPSAGLPERTRSLASPGHSCPIDWLDYHRSLLIPESSLATLSKVQLSHNPPPPGVAFLFSVDALKLAIIGLMAVFFNLYITTRM